MRKIASKHHRKAAVLDALAVTLLLTLSALMGMIVLILSTRI